MNVQVDHVTVGYNDGPSIVKDVSFTAEPGKVTTLLGPNGCGKSTLLKTLSRLLAPAEGRVLVEKKDVHLSLIHISEPTRPRFGSRMPSSA